MAPPVPPLSCPRCPRSARPGDRPLLVRSVADPRRAPGPARPPQTAGQDPLGAAAAEPQGHPAAPAVPAAPRALPGQAQAAFAPGQGESRTHGCCGGDAVARISGGLQGWVLCRIERSLSSRHFKNAALLNGEILFSSLT